MKRHTSQLLYQIQQREEKKKRVHWAVKRGYSHYVAPLPEEPHFDPYEALGSHGCDLDADIDGDTNDYEYNQCLYDRF